MTLFCTPWGLRWSGYFEVGIGRAACETSATWKFVCQLSVSSRTRKTRENLDLVSIKD